jgi:Na+-transporting NADH:ubiquinone oxidoreductase subunit NqrC
MTRTLTTLLAVTALACATLVAAKSLQLKDLPAATQKTVQDNLKGGEIKNIAKETEKGVVQYEVESILNGKHRDFNVDTKGNLIVMEEETSIDSIPAAAKATIMKKVGAGTLGLVETFTKGGGGETMYEAAWKDKAGKKHEVLVKADGTETKD